MSVASWDQVANWAWDTPCFRRKRTVAMVSARKCVGKSFSVGESSGGGGRDGLGRTDVVDCHCIGKKGNSWIGFARRFLEGEEVDILGRGNQGMDIGGAGVGIPPISPPRHVQD